jgi:hypothetical protein
MHHLSRFMTAGQQLVFSVPDMQVWLEKKYTNCINFEHTFFLTEPYVEYLLAKHGFRILNQSRFQQGHSIFYATERDPSVQPVALPPGLYEKNRQTYEAFVSYHADLIEEINRKLAATDQPAYLFGAHVFAQYLIAFGLHSEKIIALLDNDANKQGKRLYGTSLQVLPPQVLRDVHRPVVILKAGVYTEEIKQDILYHISDDVTFIE